ncbi:hypothetical protein EDC04DRAFT_2600631 [Pisolithus marmoratus]|nr:hypothetical protein EDC04DRAFT_2600631 [Pisolithus marmoratus]
MSAFKFYRRAMQSHHQDIKEAMDDELSLGKQQPIADVLDSVKERLDRKIHAGYRSSSTYRSSGVHKLLGTDLNSRIVVHVAIDANILNMFPTSLVTFCQPLRIHDFANFVSKITSNTAADMKCAMKLLDPIIRERFECMREHEEE